MPQRNWRPLPWGEGTGLLWYLEHSVFLYSQCTDPQCCLIFQYFHSCRFGSTPVRLESHVTVSIMFMLLQYFSRKSTATQEAHGCYSANPLTASTELPDLNWFYHHGPTAATAVGGFTRCWQFDINLFHISFTIAIHHWCVYSTSRDFRCLPNRNSATPPPKKKTLDQSHSHRRHWLDARSHSTGLKFKTLQ